MYALCLSPDARSQLSDQVTQNGTFSHHLFARDGRCCATAIVAIEQGLEAVSVQVRLGSTVNSLTIPKTEHVFERIACLLEELALCNDPRITPDADELTISILEPNAKRLFSQSIEGYRSANAELDAAIAKENWSAIHTAQSLRDLHASTIALIVNKCSVGIEVGVRP